MNTTTVMFLNLSCAAVAGALTTLILRGIVSRERAAVLGVGTHLAVAYIVNTTFWPPIAVPMLAGVGTAAGIAGAIRLGSRRGRR